MARAIEQLIWQAYDAFNKRDIDTALLLMTPDVDWPNGWEGGYVHGRDEVRAYWTRQWKAINPTVTPLSIQEMPDNKVEVVVKQTVKDLEGKPVFEGQVKHMYTIENGLIRNMRIEED
jgi:nuclear transport factor 2 (NTF2) superfamily protein